MTAPVLLLGWAGSTPRQLESVAARHEARGAEVLTARADILPAMGLPKGWARQGEALAARLRGRPGPIVVHLFSNAGFWLYAAALEAMTEAERGRVAAVILDSAPGVPEHIEAGFYAKYSARAMMPLVLTALGRRPRLSHPLLTPPLRAFMRVWYHLSGAQIRFSERSLSTVAQIQRPHLFLYAADDSLVKPRYVERFAAGLGARAALERFERGGHVRTAWVHRRRYWERVERFLADALATPPGEGAATGH